MTVEEEFFEAKERIMKNKPIRVPKHTKLSLDAVALEAGRSKGAIRKNRYPNLYDEIISQMEKHEELPIEASDRIKKHYKEERDKYKEMLAQAYNRELMLIKRVAELEEELKMIKQNNPMLIMKKLD